MKIKTFNIGEIIRHIDDGYGFILNERKDEENEWQWYLVKWFDFDGQEYWVTPYVIKSINDV